MLKILKFAKILEPIMSFFENGKVGGEGTELRPSYKGREFEIIVRRTK